MGKARGASLILRISCVGMKRVPSLAAMMSMELVTHEVMYPCHQWPVGRIVGSAIP